MNRVPVPPPIGERFGRLIVLREAPKRGAKRMWECRCDCGGITTSYGGHILNGHTTSCGCHKRTVLGKGTTTHGLARHPLYATWSAMRTRCRNPRHHDYPNYGARGITVDPRWDDFAAFVADMGPKPSPAHSVERVDNDGPYSPENCRWATQAEQRRNKRPRRRQTHCKHGHPLSGDNVKITAKGWRVCLACARRRGKEKWQREKRARELR